MARGKARCTRTGLEDGLPRLEEQDVRETSGVPVRNCGMKCKKQGASNGALEQRMMMQEACYHELGSPVTTSNTPPSCFQAV
jgi:hypothetical protein